MVEIIPKKASQKSKGLDAFFYLSILLLVLVLGAYFILNMFSQKENERLTSLRLEISEIMTPEKSKTEEEVLAAKAKVDDVSQLIESHLRGSKVFEIIERTTHPKVWFNRFDYDAHQKTLKLSGQTENFEILAQQFMIMEEEKTIEKVTLETITNDREGKVNFNLNLSFESNIF